MAKTDAAPLHKLKVFLSYSRQDMAFADTLESALRDRGLEPLIDRSEIFAFEDWWKRIQALIGQAATVIFVISPDSVASDVCKKEVAFAASLNKRFAPIVYRRVEDKLVPEELARLNFIFFDDETHFDESEKRLCDALETDIGWIRKHTEFGQNARAWDAAKRPKGLLLRSPLLEEAERWIALRPQGAPAPTADALAFIAESRRAASRRRNILTGSLAAGFVFALALAGLAYWERGVAKENEARAIAHEKIAEERRQEAVAQKALADQQKAIAEKKTQEAQKNLMSAGYFAYDVISKIALKLPGIAAMPADKQLEELRTLDETLIQVAGLVRAAQMVDKNVAMWGQLGGILLYFGDMKINTDVQRALKDYEEGVAVYRDLLSIDAANVVWQNGVSASLSKLGDAKLKLGDVPGAIQAYKESVEIARKIVAADPTSTDKNANLGVYYSKLGDICFADKKLAEANANYQSAVDIGEKVAIALPASPVAQRNLSVFYRQFGDVLLAENKRDEALAYYLKSLALREPLAGAGPSPAGQIDLMEIHEKLGNAQWAGGRRTDALLHYDKAVVIRETVAGNDPNLATVETAVAASYLETGDVLINEDKPTEAVEYYRKSLGYFEKAAKRIEVQETASNGKAGANTAAALGRVALLALFSRSFDKALAASDRAAALDPNLIWVQANRAHALMFAGRSDDAKKLYLAHKGQILAEQANKTWETVIGEDFDKFRKAGIEIPGATEVEGALGLH